MASDGTFNYEIEQSTNPDEHGNKLTTIKCHGRLVAENRDQVQEMVQPLTPLSGRIMIDLSDVNYLDSAGLGALIRLKMHAMKQGYCKMEFVQMTPRIMQLLNLTNLTQWFSS